MTMQIPSNIVFKSVGIKAIKFDRLIGGDRVEAVKISTEKEDPHPDYFEALNDFALTVVDLLDLGQSWLQGTIELVDAGYSVDDNPSLSIRSIVLTRESLLGEVVVKRSVKLGKMCANDIDPIVLKSLEHLWEEAWLYALGRKTAQGQLIAIDRTKQVLRDQQEAHSETATVPIAELVQA